MGRKTKTIENGRKPNRYWINEEKRNGFEHDNENKFHISFKDYKPAPLLNSSVVTIEIFPSNAFLSSESLDQIRTSTINNFIFYRCLLATAELASLPISLACSSVNLLSFSISLAKENSNSSCIFSTSFFSTSAALSSKPFGTSNLKVNSVILIDNKTNYINLSESYVGGENE